MYLQANINNFQAKPPGSKYVQQLDSIALAEVNHLASLHLHADFPL